MPDDDMELLGETALPGTANFPAVMRLRPIENAVPPQFEVAEIINLQAVRERARQGR